MIRAYRQDPAWQQAQADYVSDWPEMNPSDRLTRRTVALMWMHDIEVAFEDKAPALSSFFIPAPEGYAERLAGDLATRFDLDRASEVLAP